MSEDNILKSWDEQPMLKPRIDKVVVNLNVGKPGEPLKKASKVLQELTNQTPVKKKAKKTIREFGLRKGESIACVVTLRKQAAIDFLKKVLPVDVGIFGMDVCVSVNRPGHRVKIRRKQKTHIGSKHLLTPEESVAFVTQTLGVEIV